MFDLFGKKKRHQAMFDRAFAESNFGRYNIAINILDDLVKEGTNDFRIFNLRANVYMKSNTFPLALKDFNYSISLQPNLNVNENSYIGREMIVKSLQSGIIKASIPELLDYFQIKNTALLVYETAESIKEEFPHLNAGIISRFQILAMEYTIMRLTYDQEFSKLNSDKVFFFNSTATISKNQCDALIQELKNIISTNSLKTLNLDTYFNMTSGSSNNRVLTLATLYISAWCKDIKMVKEKADFLKHYAAFLKELKEAYTCLIEIRNFIFLNQSPIDLPEDDFKDINKMVSDERFIIILKVIDSFKEFYERPMVHSN